MTITNITTVSDNGVERVTNNQDCDNATIDGETVILDGVDSRLRATTSSGLLITNSQIKCDSDVTGGFNDESVITYGERGHSNFLGFRYSSLLFAPLSSRKNILVSELTNTTVIEGNQTRQTYCYTQSQAVLQNVIFDGIAVWEVYAPPSIASNITVRNASYGYLNWQAGRLDFLRFAVENIAIAHAWLGGWGQNNTGYHWNNDASFDRTKIRLQTNNVEYFEGYTASWNFRDRDTAALVNDVLVIYRDDFSGSDSEVGRYVSNTEGRLVGTLSTQKRVSVPSQELGALFILTGKSNTALSTYSSPGGGASYDFEDVTPKIEIRSYAHERPSGFSPDDNFTISAEIGVLASDYTVSDYADFILIIDSNITVTASVASAYTELDNAEKFYNRAKAEWRLNDGFPYLSRDGEILNLGSFDLVGLNSGDVYNFAGNTITAKTDTFNSDIQGSGSVSLHAIGEGKTIIDAAEVTLSNYPTVFTVDNTIVNVEGTIDVSGWTFRNGSSLRLTQDATVTTGGNTGLTIDANGFTLTRDDNVQVTFAGMPTTARVGTLVSGDAFVVIEELDSSFNPLATPVYVDLNTDISTGSGSASLKPTTNYRYKGDCKKGFDRANQDEWVTFTTTGNETIAISCPQMLDSLGTPLYGNGDPVNLALMSFDALTMEVRFINTSGSPITFTFNDVFDHLDDSLSTPDSIKAGFRKFTFDSDSKKIISPAPANLFLNDAIGNNARCYLDFVAIEAGESTPRSMIKEPFSTVYGLEMAHDIITATGGDVNIVEVAGTSVSSVDDFKYGGLNEAELHAGLNSYDSPTNAGLNTVEANIITAVSGAGITPQEVRDAMSLAPTGTVATDSIDDKLNGLETQVFSLNDLDSAAIESAVNAALSTYDTVTQSDLDSVSTALTNLLNVIDNKVDIVDGIVDGIDLAGAKQVLLQSVESAINEVDLELNDLASSQAVTDVYNKLCDVWQLMGLDPSNPLTITKTSASAGNVTQEIVGDCKTTNTVTRL